MGALHFDGDTFTVLEAYICDVSNSGSETEIHPEEFGKAAYKMRMLENSCKFHWHTHPTFNTFWSKTDRDLISQLTQSSEWVVALVMNQKGEYRAAASCKVNVFGKEQEHFIDDIKVEVYEEVDQSILDIWDKEYSDVEKRCEDRRPKIINPLYHYQSNYYGREDNWRRRYDERYEKMFAPSTKPDIEQYHDPHSEAYDHQGCLNINNSVVYNPHYDMSIVTDKELHEALIDMDERDKRILMNTGTFFRDYWEWFVSQGEDNGASDQASGHNSIIVT